MLCNPRTFIFVTTLNTTFPALTMPLRARELRIEVDIRGKMTRLASSHVTRTSNFAYRNFVISAFTFSQHAMVRKLTTDLAELDSK